MAGLPVSLKSIMGRVMTNEVNGSVDDQDMVAQTVENQETVSADTEEVASAGDTPKEIVVGEERLLQLEHRLSVLEQQQAEQNRHSRRQLVELLAGLGESLTEQGRRIARPSFEIKAVPEEEEFTEAVIRLVGSEDHPYLEQRNAEGQWVLLEDVTQQAQPELKAFVERFKMKPQAERFVNVYVYHKV